MALTPEAGPEGRDTEVVLRTLLEQSVAGIYILDRAGTIRYINARFAELCGFTPSQMIGRSVFDFIADEELAERRVAFARLATGDVPTLQTMGMFKQRSGEPIALLTQSTVARYGGEIAIIGVVADMSQRRSIERELQRANHAARVLSAANSALVRAGDEGELLQEMCNIALASGAYSLAWVGFAEHDPEKHVRPVARAGRGTDVLDQFPARWDDSERAQGPAGIAIRTKTLALIRAGDQQLNPWQQFMTSYHQNGSLIGLPLIDGTGAAFGALTLAAEDAHAFGGDEVELLVQLADDIGYGIAALRDRKARRIAEEGQRAHATRLESLWRIVNNPRLTGDELTVAMLAEATAAIRPGLLVEVAAGLSERTVPGEITGRLGGDVFAVFIPEPRSLDFVRERAVHFAERFRHGFSTGDRAGKEFISLTAGFGMAVAPHHGTTLDALISHASVAVSAAKARGRGTMLFYETGMEGDAERNITFRNELADALAGDQFELYFQPHINILTGEKTGCEALIRWRHPDRGLVAPGQFIPAAERLGLIGDIDAWVLRAALLKARAFKQLRSDFRLYFNLSGRQAGDPKLIDALKEAAADGVPLQNIGIEITESDAMRDFEATREVCLAARALGVRVAIDDFGTGYSSLSSLKRLPVDLLKIDRSFISGILTDRHDEAIVETIIAMTRLFECDVLAEGVEAEGEMDWLRRHACTYVQGYFVARPMPLDAFIAWMSG